MSDTNQGPRRVPERPVPDDDIAVRLLRLAGHRPPVPAADAAIVKEAARVEWRRAVWMNRRRKLAWRTTGGLLAAAALVFLVVRTGVWREGVTRAPSAQVATVAVVHGEAVATDGVSAMALVVGQGLSSGTRIETVAQSAGGVPGRVAFRLAMDGGPALRLDVGSVLRLHSTRVVELERGAVYVDSGGKTLTVQTDRWTVTNVGTRYELRLLTGPDAGSLRVRVRDGEVRLTDERDQEHSVAAGKQVVVRADGTLDRPTDVEPYDPEWCWAANAWPPMDVDEPTALEVLDWVACETGQRLRFADGVDSAALDVRLRGSKLSCTREDCIDLAFLALGRQLRHRSTDTELWVERRDQAEDVR